jgi:type VI secretion system protein ImpA
MRASLADIDLVTLLKPFEGDSSAGADPREDFSPQAPYRALRTARNAARTTERAADADPNAEQSPPPEWRSVRQLGVKLLAETCKDLEVAAWLTEALVRAEGLAGLTAGAQLIAGLVRGFWDQGLLPPIDQEGISARVSPVEGLSGATGDGTIVQPLRKLVLFSRPDGTPVPLYGFEQSVKLRGETDANRVKQRVAAGVVPFEEMERDARVAGAAVFAALRTEARAALAAWQDMSAVFDTAAGIDGPSTTRVRGVLESILEIAARFAPPEAAAPEAAPDDAVVMDDAEGAPAAPGAKAAHAAPQNREDMLRELGRIADFFRRTEPHSPLSYTLDEAVRRGRMSLPDLLEELVPDANARGAILTQLGIKMQKPA